MRKYTAIELIVDAVAVFRLTKLVTEDVITQDIRDFIFKKTPRGSKLRVLITCGWCSSFWAAVVIVALRRAHPASADIVSTTLALSAATGVLFDKGL